jgi:hypothetical protein
MSFINMLSWWQWALLGAIPPAIVLLYFLKLKRTPLDVPSTFLWRKSIEDLHVNSIWQRLRTSLLLLLQILLVLLVMAALVRPGWSGRQLVGDRYVFLIDNSASMQSTDVKPTRLDEAKRRIAELIEQMASGDVAMIVSFSDAAQVEQVFTDNRRELLSRLSAIRPTNRATSLGEALRVAAGLANSQRAVDATTDAQPEQGLPATLYLFSDGKFSDVQNFKLGNLKPVFVPIGQPAAANVAITAFTLRRREDDKNKLQAFGRLQNFGPADATADVELYHNDQLLDSSTVDLKPSGSGGVVFDLGEMPSGVLKLVTRTGGELQVDDEAWTSIDPPKRSRVLVITPGNDALKLALETESASELADIEFAEPAVLDTKDYEDRSAAGSYVLIIYDQCRPKSMPQANTLFIGRLPPDASWAATSEVVTAASQIAAPQIIDVEVTHPLMQLIDLGNVRFAEGQMLSPPAGATILITTATGPLFAIAPRGGYEDAVLGAEIVGRNEQGERFANTDWPLRVSFPVFVLNALSYFGDSTVSGTVPSVQPGRTIALKGSGSAGKLTVRTPTGRVTSFDRAGGESVQFSDTNLTGVYVVEEVGQAPRHFSVNLFDPAESNIEPRSEVQIGFDEVSGQASWEGGRFELWRPLLIAVLGVLCLEWYIYNRRVYV